MRETQREAKRPTRQDSPPGAAPQCLGLAPSMGAGSAGHAAPLLGRASSAPRERFSGGEAITASSFLFFLAARRRSSTCRSPDRPGTERRERQEGRRRLKGRAEREVRLRGEQRTAPTCPPSCLNSEAGGGRGGAPGTDAQHARAGGRRRKVCAREAGAAFLLRRPTVGGSARTPCPRGPGRRWAGRAEGGQGACGAVVRGGWLGEGLRHRRGGDGSCRWPCAVLLPTGTVPGGLGQ